MNNIKNKLGLSILVILLGLVPNFAWAQSNTNAMVEAAVRFYFADIPVMIDIAKCETNYRQYSTDGSALYDASQTYVGVYQIAESIHTAKATSLGFDIRGIDGNLQYARHLYNVSGTNPWKGCLPKQTTPTTAPTTTAPAGLPSGSFTTNLRIGMTSPEVKLLQTVLNQNGFVVTTSGGGSVGNETNFFGSLTREAVKRFQCAKQIVCEGNEATTGFGRVGPTTRGILNSLIKS